MLPLHLAARMRELKERPNNLLAPVQLVILETANQLLALILCALLQPLLSAAPQRKPVHRPQLQQRADVIAQHAKDVQRVHLLIADCGPLFTRASYRYYAINIEVLELMLTFSIVFFHR